MVSEDVSDDELQDLGEPVEDMRMFSSPGCLTPTITHDQTVSDLKTNLTLKFDLESSGRKNVRGIDNNKQFRTNDNFKKVKENGELENWLKDETSKDSYRYQTAKPVQQKTKKPGASRKSNNGMIVRRVTRSFYRKGNRFFIRKTQCRYTLRNLLTTKDFAVCSTKNLHVLLKCLSIALRECGLLTNERKMLSRQQRLLKRELRNRDIFKKRPREHEVSSLGTTGFDVSTGTFSKIYTQEEKCEFLHPGHNFGTRKKIDVHTDSVGSDRRSLARSKKMNACSLKDEKKFENNASVFKRRVSDHSASESFERTKTVDSSCDRFPEEPQNDCTDQSKKIGRDEIDDIFSSLGL